MASPYSKVAKKLGLPIQPHLVYSAIWPLVLKHVSTFLTVDFLQHHLICQSVSMPCAIIQFSEKRPQSGIPDGNLTNFDHEAVMDKAPLSLSHSTNRSRLKLELLP